MNVNYDAVDSKESYSNSDSCRLIVLSAYEDRASNPFPDIGAILVDESGIKVLSTHFTPRSEFTKDIQKKKDLTDIELKEFFVELNKTSNIMITITEKHEIMLIYSDPDKGEIDKEVSTTKFVGQEEKPSISLEILAIAKEYCDFFRVQDPA